MYISYVKFLKPTFNEQIIHSQLYAAFPAAMGRALYKKESNIQNGELSLYTIAIVLSEKKPFSTENVEIIKTQEIAVAFQKGEMFKFEIKLNPTYKKPHGNRVPERLFTKRIEYVKRKFEKAGATIIGSPLEHSKEVTKIVHTTGNQLITSYTYTGTIVVDNPLMFKQAYERGIGHCKAYGCGMLLLKRL